MNRFRTQFLALLAVMLLGTVTASAVDYGLLVGETRVTSDNASDVLGNGQFRYDNTTKTLTVTNATLNNSGTQGSGISNRSVSGLTIKLVGTNRFYTRMEPIDVAYSTTITGTGTLYAVSQERDGFESSSLSFQGSNVTLTINGPKLYFTNKSGSAIYDWKGNCTLRIEGTSTVVSFKTSGSEFAWTHHPLYNLSLGSGLYLTRPYRAYFSSSLKNITTDGRTAAKGDFLISSKPTEAEKGYGLYIGETEVTSYNCDDVNGDEMFVYHPDSKELDVRSGTFRNDGTRGGGIDNRGVDGLLVWVTGTAYFYTRQEPISSSKSFTIAGPGTINGTSSDSYGMYLWGDGITCTVAGPTLNLTSNKYAALKDYYGTATLRVEKSDRYSLGSSSYITSVNLTPASDKEAVSNLGNLSMGADITISEPAWGAFSSSLKTVTKDEYQKEAYKGKVTIGVGWPLFINGTKVTAKNAGSISGPGISGSMSYNPATKVLSLNGATVSGTDHNCIQNNSVSGLTINVSGTNNFTLGGGGGLQMLCLMVSTTITGSGTLNLNSTSNNYCARVFYGSKLTIDGPTINGNTQIEALAFYPGQEESLEIKGTSTRVSLTPGDGRATVKDLTNFTLGSGLYVTQPKGAYFNSSLKSFTVGGSKPVSENLVISRTNPANVTDYGVYIGETMVNSFNASDVLGNGQFSYSNATKTLTLRNANLTNTGTLGTGISNREVDGLQIKLEGTSNITSRNGAIAAEKNTTIYGTGTLNCVSTGSAGLRLAGQNITVAIVNGPNVKFSGKTGLSDYYGTGTLRVQGSETNVTLTPASGYAAISNLKELTLSSTTIMQPAGGTFSSSLKSVTTDGQTAYKGTVNIGGYSDYGILVAETAVTSLNASDVLGDGHFSYNASTNTLTVKDANLENYEGRIGSGILNWSNNGLTVKVEGNSTFKTRNQVIGGQASFTLTGSGTITGTAQYAAGIYLGSENITCTINGPQLDITSSLGAGLESYYASSTLKMQGSSKLTLNPGNGQPAVKNLGTLTLSGQYITSPAFAEFSSAQKSITVGGEPYAGQVVISGSSPSTPMYIGETAVKTTNASDILGNGQFKYDIATRTLTVTNANFENTGSLGSGIDNRTIVGLNIRLVGNNVINARNNPVTSSESFRITGTGSLTGTSAQSVGIQLGSRCDSCIIDGPTINLSGANGLRDYLSNSVLRIQGSRTSVTLASTRAGQAAISGLNALELYDGLQITEPVGATFSSQLKSITADGTTAVKGQVVIGPEVDYGFLVADIVVTSSNAADILGDGTFSYNPSTNTLTMKDANVYEIERFQGTGIDIRTAENLVIDVEGTNYITTRNSVFASLKSFTITGTGTIEALSTSSPSFLFWSDEDMTCTINGPKINAKGVGGGVKDAYSTATLSIDGSSTLLTLQGGVIDPNGDFRQVEVYENIVGLKSLQLGRGITIMEPQGASFNQQLGTVTTDGQTAYMGKIVIGTDEYYGIYVAETSVMASNADDILGDGCFSYDAENKVLYVRNANLANEGILGTGISNREVEWLTVAIEGNNVFNTRQSVIHTEKPLNITGTGTLVGTATGSNALYLATNDESVSCNIFGPTIDLTSANSSAVSDWRSNGSLFVGGSTTQLILTPAAGSPAISGLLSLSVDTCLQFVEPEGAWFDPQLMSVTTDGQTRYAGRVVIGSGKPQYFTQATEDSVSVAYHVTGDNTVEVGAQNGQAVELGVTELEIPETVGDYTVTGVAGQAFEWNYSLSAVYLPATIETIGYGAFQGCSSLTDVYMYGRRPVLLGRDGAPTDDNDAFFGLPAGFDPTQGPVEGARSLGGNALDGDNFGTGATLHVPFELVDEYNVAPWNSWFSNILGDAQRNVYGDVNGDKAVDVADIATVIDIMAHSTFAKNGDVNNDGAVDVADIATIIDIMAANARRLKMTYGE